MCNIYIRVVLGTLLIGILIISGLLSNSWWVGSLSVPVYVYVRCMRMRVLMLTDLYIRTGTREQGVYRGDDVASIRNALYTIKCEHRRIIDSIECMVLDKNISDLHALYLMRIILTVVSYKKELPLRARTVEEVHMPKATAEALIEFNQYNL